MSEDEDYDELPPITVNCSGRDSGLFAMPCAADLAAQRARERSCERELARLRPPHSDSSGSEGEAALAAAVTALRVRTAPRAPPAPRLAALLAAAAPHLPARAAAFLREYARAGAPPARTTLRRMERRLAAGALTPSEAAACGAWLCLALAAAERAALGAAGARAAHGALAAAGAHAAALAPALLAAVPAPRARLRLADALRAGGSDGALPAVLVRRALADLLETPRVAEDHVDEETARACAARWRRLDARAQLAALRLAARAHAAAPAAARLPAALAAAPHAARDHSPDALKVLVAASKIQVLFPARR